ncbi:hypothetical protein Tco_0117203 [Tanacetum coccineum]
MSQLSVDRVALDEYMAVWFRGEVPDAVDLRSTAIRFRNMVEEGIANHRIVIDHLTNGRGCPTSGWLERLRVNQAEDLEQLGILNLFVSRLYGVIRKRDEDVAAMDY